MDTTAMYNGSTDIPTQFLIALLLTPSKNEITISLSWAKVDITERIISFIEIALSKKDNVWLNGFYPCSERQFEIPWWAGIKLMLTRLERFEMFKFIPSHCHGNSIWTRHFDVFISLNYLAIEACESITGITMIRSPCTDFEAKLRAVDETSKQLGSTPRFTTGGSLCPDDPNFDLAITRTKFIDPTFPPNDSSLFLKSKKSTPETDIVWIRACELAPEPCLFANGKVSASVIQGTLSDPWLVSAVAALTIHPTLISRVIPHSESQDFINDPQSRKRGNYYKGYYKSPDLHPSLFRFRFHTFGSWIEVLIDDYLPCHPPTASSPHPTLAGSRSKDPNEFWVALLEKAYAKLMGGYEGLRGVRGCSAFVDLSGNVPEMVDLKNQEGLLNFLGPGVGVEITSPNNSPGAESNGGISSSGGGSKVMSVAGMYADPLFYVMRKEMSRGSLMSCSMQNEENGNQENDLGLVYGHSYAISAVLNIKVRMSNMRRRKVKLVKLRNPWGDKDGKAGGYTGAWAEWSPEWQLVTKRELKRLNLEFDDDGAFFMSFDDFLKNFTSLIICRQLDTPSSLSKNSKTLTAQFFSAWDKSKRTAGGCINYPLSFTDNPQYLIQLDEPSELMVSLMQKDSRWAAMESGWNVASTGLSNMGGQLQKIEKGGGDGIDRSGWSPGSSQGTLRTSVTTVHESAANPGGPKPPPRSSTMYQMGSTAAPPSISATASGFDAIQSYSLAPGYSTLPSGKPPLQSQTLPTLSTPSSTSPHDTSQRPSVATLEPSSASQTTPSSFFGISLTSLFSSPTPQPPHAPQPPSPPTPPINETLHPPHLSIGFALLRVEENRKYRIHTPAFEVVHLTTYVNAREMFGRVPSLRAGRYVLLPTTFEPGREGEFWMRVAIRGKTKGGVGRGGVRELVEDGPVGRWGRGWVGKVFGGEMGSVGRSLSTGVGMAGGGGSTYPIGVFRAEVVHCLDLARQKVLGEGADPYCILRFSEPKAINPHMASSFVTTGYVGASWGIGPTSQGSNADLTNNNNTYGSPNDSVTNPGNDNSINGANPTHNSTSPTFINPITSLFSLNPSSSNNNNAPTPPTPRPTRLRLSCPRTRVHKSTLNPIFDSGFMFPVSRPREAWLQLEVWNRYPLRTLDRFMGCAVVRVEDYMRAERCERTWEIDLALRPSSSYPNANVKGSVRLRVRYESSLDYL
ncbi:Calpain-6 [Chytridiales sp. JEL 0842]|nr:Calpain-6 [Chytridiales sp. JEL 0842]